MKDSNFYVQKLNKNYKNNRKFVVFKQINFREKMKCIKLLIFIIFKL